MARYVIYGDENLATFSQRFVLDGCTMRLPEANDVPTVDRRDREIRIYIILFEQVGLRLPLNCILCEVLRWCNIAL